MACSGRRERLVLRALAVRLVQREHRERLTLGPPVHRERLALLQPWVPPVQSVQLQRLATMVHRAPGARLVPAVQRLRSVPECVQMELRVRLARTVP